MPKEEYYNTIDTLESAAANDMSKSKNEYYLLSKEVMLRSIMSK